MPYCEANAPSLPELMNEALRVCEQLLHFSEEARAVFLGEDERAILRAIEARETIIDRLIGLEYRIDLVLDANDEYACGGALPEEAESARLKARDILGAVMGMDVRAMRHVRLRMQKDKDETLKARNKKHLSAYIRASAAPCSRGSYDYIK